MDIKNLIVYNKLLELKEYINDDELNNLLAKYRCTYSESAETGYLHICSKCEECKPKSEMFVYDHNGTVSNSCKDCKDKYSANAFLLGKIIEVMPSPNQDVNERLIDSINKFNSGLIEKHALDLYYEEEFLCGNCTHNNTTENKYIHCETERCPFYKRFKFFKSIRKNSLNEEIENKSKAQALITNEHIDLKVALLRLNRKIKETKFK